MWELLKVDISPVLILTCFHQAPIPLSAMANTGFSQQVLEKIRLTVTATAVIWMRIDHPEIKTTTGVLSPEGFDDLASAVERYWPVTLGPNVIRYAGLTIDGRFCLMFVNRLPDGDHWLGLLFPLRTSFQRMRQDMMIFIKNLQGKNSLESGLGQRLEYILQHKSHLTPDIHEENMSGQDEVNWIGISELIEEAEDPQMLENMSYKSDKDSKELYQAMQKHDTIDTNVEDVANVHSFDGAWLKVDDIEDETSLKFSGDGWRHVVENRQEEGNGSIDHESPPFLGTKPQEEQNDAWQVLQETNRCREDLVSIFQEKFELRDAVSGLNEWFKPPGVVDEQTKPDSGGGYEQMISSMDFNEVSTLTKYVVSDITFCLAPFLDEHFLLGKLAANLRNWFPAICDQYSWQLNSFSVRPKYLKWTLCDFPESLITEMFQIIRRQTSQRLFQVFPELQEGNPFGDFWSPGFLVNSKEGQVAT